MDSQIKRELLKENHYVRLASSDNFWFDFRKNVLAKYRKTRQDNFCLIITNSENFSDSYVLPYSLVKSLFQDADVDNRGRWMGTVEKDILKIHASSLSMDISNFYNRFDLLENNFEYLEPEPAIPSMQEEFSLQNLHKHIQEFNLSFNEATPYKKLNLSERISRPGSISTLVKKLQNYKCQICQIGAFKKKNGVPYAEAHHIIELHNLIKGSYCSDNIIVVCPNCHKKLHYADIKYKNSAKDSFEISINNEPSVIIKRNILTEIKLSEQPKSELF
jgi:5-methylcytosine-specific restriction endonuclease McrA